MSDQLDGLTGVEAMRALYGNADSVEFEALPDDYRNDLRAIMISLEHRPNITSLERFYVAANLRTRSMRPARTLDKAKAAILEGFKHGLQFDKEGTIWKVIDLGSGEVIHAADVFSETIEY